MTILPFFTVFERGNGGHSGCILPESPGTGAGGRRYGVYRDWLRETAAATLSGFSVKKSACRSHRSLGEGAALAVFLPEEFHGRRSGGLR